MSFLNSVIDFIVKTFWPWFLKYAWPIIKEYVLDIVKTIFAELTEKLKKMFSEQGKQGAASADGNAAAAQAKAYVAPSAAEKDKWEAIAAVWRDAANMFREENEQLKKRVEAAIAQAESTAEEKIQTIDLSMHSTSGTPVLTLGHQSTALPIPEKDTTEQKQ
jgi:hypothetical protein